MKRKNLLIFIICYISYASIYLARLNLSISSPELIGAGMLNESQIGLLGGVFSVIFAIGRTVFGSLSDKKAPWIMISTGLLLTGVSNLVIGFLPVFIGMVVLWSLNAIAQSMLWSSMLCVMSSIYDPEKAKSKTALLVTSVATGNIIVIPITMLLLKFLPIQFIFVIPGAVSLIMALAAFLAVKDIPSSSAKIVKAHIPVKDLLKNKEFSLQLVPAVLHGVLKDNIPMWMTLFFTMRYMENIEDSVFFLLFIPVMGLAGRSAYPILYRLCGNNEHKVSLFGFIVCFVCCGTLCFESIPKLAATVCLGISYAAISAINTSILSIFPLRFIETGNTASISGIMDLMTYCGTGISSLIFGIVIENSGFTPMFITWAACSILSVPVTALLMKRRARG